MERSTEKWIQPHLEGMSERDVLEMQEPMLLIEYRKHLLEKYSDIEAEIHLVNDVLNGYGIEETLDNVVLGEN